MNLTPSFGWQGATVVDRDSYVAWMRSNAASSDFQREFLASARIILAWQPWCLSRHNDFSSSTRLNRPVCVLKFMKTEAALIQ